MGTSYEGEFMVDFDRKADTNVTFRGYCRCAEGFMYE
jgi:hypothetical protein